MENYLSSVFDNLRIADLVDVGIIATFVYMALVWFKKTRARFVMIGLFILGFIYVLARLFNLYLTTMVFRAFFAIFLIMIVIIFQDEFRRFFERVALWGVIRKKRRLASFNRNIDILANALANLSRKNIGALVVVKGRDPLGRHIQGGAALNGALSQTILESIFAPHTPTHDGAVIVEGGRIVSFGCHLPLSMNIQRMGHLGTRHAAALGLSERADAICLVVSEEEGTISIAEGEKMRRLDDIGSLRLRLEDFYRKRFPRRRRLWSELLTGHILEKLLALALSCGLWLVFSQQRQEIVRRDFVIPIEYRNLAPDWIIGEPKPKQATAALSGIERVIDLMDSEELRVSLDMSGVKQGDNEFAITKDLVRRPSGVSVVSLSPTKIKLKIYKLLNIDIPVEVNTIRRLSSSLVLRGIRVEPEKVSVVVPSILPQDEIKIVTEPIDLRKIRETRTLTPKIAFPKEMRFVAGKPPQVKVTVEVEKRK
ncbi:MAG: diadenylate cyclase [Candidatus Omnitrophota bacterium]